MTKQEISEEIKALLVIIDALLEQHGLEIEDFPQFAAIYRAAERRVAQVQNLKRAAKVVPARYLNDDPSSIRRGVFLATVAKGLDSLTAHSAELDKKKDFTVDISLFTEKLSKVKCKTRFGTEFRLYIQENLVEYPDAKVVTIDEVFSNAIRHFTNDKLLKSHYSSNLDSYHSDKVVVDDLAEDMGKFANLLLAATDIPIINDDAYIETTPEFKENLANRSAVENKLIKFSEEISKATFSRYNALTFPKDLKLDCVKIKKAFQQYLKTDDKETQRIYDSIIKKFDFQVEMFCRDALQAVISTIDAFERNEDFTQQYVDSKNFSPSFVDADIIANILADAKADGSNDANKDTLLQDQFKAWKEESLNTLKLMEGDTQNTADLDAIRVVVEDFYKINPEFGDFWGTVSAIIAPEQSETNIAEIKQMLRDTIRGLKHNGLDTEYTLTTKLPDIAVLSGAINDARLDTSFQHYLAQWTDWSKENFINEIKVNDKSLYYIQGLKDNLTSLFGYEHAGEFFKDDVIETIDLVYSTQGSEEHKYKIDGRALRSAWKILLSKAAPRQKDYELLKQRYIGDGKELYNYIITYTKYLPTAADLQLAISDAQKKEKKSKGRLFRGVLVGEFARLEWGDMTIRALYRAFKTDIKAYLKKDEKGFYYISSIGGKLMQTNGLAIRGNKVTFSKGTSKVSNDTSTQVIHVVFYVDSFGSASWSVGANAGAGNGTYQGGGNVSHADSAPIGSGEYKATLTFKHTKNGNEDRIDINGNDLSVSDLPDLSFNEGKSSFLTAKDMRK